MSEVWINDVDLADYGFVLSADPGHAAAPSLSDGSAPLIGSLGSVWTGQPVQAAPRRLLIAGHIIASSSAQFLTYADALKALATVGAPRIRFADRPTQEFRDARVSGDVQLAPRNAILSNVAGDFRAQFECVDPLRYDVQPQGIPLSTARAALPIGTGPSHTLIAVHGNGGTLSAITITIRNASGDVVQTMGLTVSLGANDYILIDSLKTAITLYTAGVASNALSAWTSGDFLLARSIDGWNELGQNPTIEVAGTGTPGGLCTFARAWL